MIFFLNRINDGYKVRSFLIKLTLYVNQVFRQKSEENIYSVLMLILKWKDPCDAACGAENDPHLVWTFDLEVFLKVQTLQYW